MRRSISRRDALVAVTVAAAFAPARRGRADPSILPAQPTILVAGPVGSEVDRWAEAIAPPLGRQMLGGTPLGWENVGGADGVTGINQFQARTAPDGTTALLLPGAALLAWLVGDTRARFDAGAWAPLWGGTTPALVATRGPLAAERPLRFAAESVAGPELEGLLALRLMGIDADPVPVGTAAALRGNDADAIYLRGAAMRRWAGALAGLGWRPAFVLGRARSPARPDVPAAAELFVPSRLADADLAAAFRAVSAAASLDVALVLQAVTPAAVLAWWRRGCEQLDEESQVRAAAAAAALRQADPGELAAQLGRVTLDTGAMLSLRTLLADRYHYRAG